MLTYTTVLDPSGKINHVRRYWGADKLDEVLMRAEEIVGSIFLLDKASLINNDKYKERYKEMYASNAAPPRKNLANLTTRKVGVLFRELSDNEEGLDTDMEDDFADPNDPWRADFKGYLHSRDQLGTMTTVEWWGVCIHISKCR